MTVKRTYTNHEYAYSGGRWLMIKCGCSNTAPICSEPQEYPRGGLTDCTSRQATDEDYDRLDAKLMQLESPIPY